MMTSPRKAIKRQAETVIPESPTKRRCILRLAQSHFNRSIARPEPNSINHILREQCRTRLYVAPIFWRENHMRLLQCNFVLKNLQLRPDEPGNNTQCPSESPPTMQQPNSQRRYSRAIRAAKKIGRPGLESINESVITDLLKTFNISRSL